MSGVMKISPPRSPLSERRLDVFRRHVPAFLRMAQLSYESWSDDVVATWDAELAPYHGPGRWNRGPELFKRCKANGQNLRRLLSDDEAEGHIPADDLDLDVIELTLLSAGYVQCSLDLALRAGGLFVRLPPNTAAAAMTGMAELLREVSEALATSATVYANGGIDAGDSEADLLALRRQLMDVPVAAHAIVSQIDAELASRRAGGAT